jgi:hypothetical protein
MGWKQLLASITGSVDRELLLRKEYLFTENRILPQQNPGRVRLSDGERMILATIGAFQRTIAAGAHSLRGTPGWAAQILSSQRGMSIMTERGVPTYAPQRQAVTLEQAIVVATAGLHIPRNSCVQGCAYECVED